MNNDYIFFNDLIYKTFLNLLVIHDGNKSNILAVCAFELPAKIPLAADSGLPCSPVT